MRLSWKVAINGGTLRSPCSLFRVSKYSLHQFGMVVDCSSAFQAPGSPSGMQAMLEHSVQNYGPLPSELCPRRVRTSSRPSPYPQQSAKSTMLPEKTRSSFAELNKASFADLKKTPVLQPINSNKNIMAAAPSLEALKPFSPLVVDIEPKQEKAFVLARDGRPRVGSNARRTALGWSKRSTGKSSTDQMENAVGSGIVVT